MTSKNTCFWKFVLRAHLHRFLVLSGTEEPGGNPHPLYIYKHKKAGVENIQCDCASVRLQKALRKDPRQGTTKMKAIDQLPHVTHAYIPPFRAGELIHSYL